MQSPRTTTTNSLEEIEKRALEVLTRAREDLLRTLPFFGHLAMQLRTATDLTIRTAAVDGTTLAVNPYWYDSLSHLERIGVLAHEIMHCANMHPWRRGDRERSTWNLACDYAINSILLNAGFTLPKDAVFDDTLSDMAAERVYDALVSNEGGNLPRYAQNKALQDLSKKLQDSPSPQGGGEGETEGQDAKGEGGEGQEAQGEGGEEEGQQGEGEGQSPLAKSLKEASKQLGTDPGGCGEVKDAPSPEGPEEERGKTAGEWRTTISSLCTRKSVAGTIPGAIRRAITRIVRPPCRDLNSALQEYLAQTARDDYSWRMPNVRHMQRGFYLPSMHSEGILPFAIAVDVSGSITKRTLDRFIEAAQQVLDVFKPEYILLLACDCQITYDNRIYQGEELPREFSGGGGTFFTPAIERAESEDPPVSCLIYLTDLEGDYPLKPPGIPILWVVSNPQCRRREPPPGFGPCIYIED
jgi:predicted metal-dependent peptidase